MGGHQRVDPSEVGQRRHNGCITRERGLAAHAFSNKALPDNDGGRVQGLSLLKKCGPCHRAVQLGTTVKPSKAGRGMPGETGFRRSFTD